MQVLSLPIRHHPVPTIGIPCLPPSRMPSCGACRHSERQRVSVTRLQPLRLIMYDAGNAILQKMKHAKKDCKIRASETTQLDTFKMVMFQVKLSTAFCSFRSFKPSLVPMLCRCSWNSMAERHRKTKDFTLHPIWGSESVGFIFLGVARSPTTGGIS